MASLVIVVSVIVALSCGQIYTLTHADEHLTPATLIRVRNNNNNLNMC